LKQIDQICFDSKGTNLACKLLKLSVDKGQSFEELYVKFKEEGIKSGAFYIQNDLISFCKPKRMKIGWDGEPSTDPATYDICTPWKCNMVRNLHPCTTNMMQFYHICPFLVRN